MRAAEPTSAVAADLEPTSTVKIEATIEATKATAVAAALEAEKTRAAMMAAQDAVHAFPDSATEDDLEAAGDVAWDTAEAAEQAAHAAALAVWHTQRGKQ